MPIATTNPATGEVERTFEEISRPGGRAHPGAAASTFRTYRTTTFAERGAWMVGAAGILEDEVDRIATVMTTEMGKTLAAARAEVLKCAKACRYFAEHAESFLVGAGRRRRGGRGRGLCRAGSRSARCSPSCRGISLCGRRCGSPPRRSWPETSAC